MAKWRLNSLGPRLASKPGSPRGGRGGGVGEREKRAWYTLTAHASNCTRMSGTLFIIISSVSYSQRGCSQSAYGGRSRHG